MKILIGQPLAVDFFRAPWYDKNTMSHLLLANPLFGAAGDGRGFYFFGFEIYYYALCIVSGMIAAAVASGFLMKRRNMSSDFIFTLFLCCIPVALVGARLFYCITGAVPIKQWLDVRDGGLSIIGGASAGVLMGFVVCKIKKVNFFRAADCVVLNILLAHMFGRWGNFFNGEIYGAPVANDSMKWFPFAVPIDGTSGIGAFSNPNATWHYAFFFYEGTLCVIFWALLYAAAWYWNKKPNGLFTFSYFLVYGIMRTIMEPLRDPRDILSGNSGIPWSMVTSILYIVLAVVAVGLILFFNYRKEGALFGSKKGDPCGITEYLKSSKDEVPYYSKINMFGDQYPPKPPKEKGESLIEQFKNLFKKKTDEEDAPNDAEECGTPAQTETEEKAGDTAEQPAQEEEQKEE